MANPLRAALALAAALAAAAPGWAASPSAERGQYLFNAGGCAACHTDERGGGGPLSGGPPIATPFGTFYGPNITPDRRHGIGRWTDADFIRAMREGVGPDGQHYYPVFPYTSYTKVPVADLLDIWAYLATVPAAGRPSREHDVPFPFSFRSVLAPWRWFNFEPGEWRPRSDKSPEWNRGAYLVEALGHCGECHTPRNFMGGLDRSRWMAGARIGGETPVAPNLTPHSSGLGRWSEDDIAFSLMDGVRPDGGAFGGEMRLVVQHGTSRLTEADRRAIASYLMGLPPLPSAVATKTR